MFPAGRLPLGRTRRLLVALGNVNRIPETVGYNLAYFFIGVALAWPTVPSARLALVGWFGVGVVLAKMQASAADAIHDRAVDAINPEKSRIARGVDRLGARRVWSLVVAEAVGAMAAFGVVAVRTGQVWFLGLGAAFVLLGFWYSYPPRLKERGVCNHVVTTGVDVCFVVLPIPYLLVGALTPRVLGVGAVIALYSFAYHVVHQAADAYYDREMGVDTFARSVGVPASLALSGALSGAAGLLATALGYYLAAVAAVAAAGYVVFLGRRVRGGSLREQSETVTSLYDIAWVATLLNAATGLSVLLGAGSLPV